MTDKTLEQLKAEWDAAEAVFEASWDALEAARDAAEAAHADAAYDAFNACLNVANKAKCAYFKALDAQENSND